jgi:DegV family protein with EDD domain
MGKVALVTDTVASIPQELIKSLGIHVVPVGFMLDGQKYRDQVDIHPDEFWARFKTMKKFTSFAPTPGEFVAAFEQASQDTDNIAVVVISKALSACYQSALQGREIIKMQKPQLNIEVLDSKAFTGSEGFIVIEGARAAQTGKSLAEVVQLMQNMTGRVRAIGCLETLKYLIRSGRAPKVAYLGELMGIKPIVGGIDGSGLVQSLGTAKGKQKCFERIVQMVSEYSDTNRPLHVMVNYTNNIDDGKKVLEMVKARYNPVESYLTFQSPLSGGHTGPILVISFYT